MSLGDLPIFLIWSKFAGMLVYCWVTVDPMQLMSSPHITKCETDSGWKSRYYAIIFSGKNDHGLWSLSTVEQFLSSFLTTAGSDLHLHLECTRSTQDLTLTEANTCLVDTVSLHSASLYLSSTNGLPCHSNSIWVFIHCLFYVRLSEVTVYKCTQ